MDAVYRQHGWFLLDAEYPLVSVIFTAPHLTPPAVVFGAELDFTNYDLEPPAVRLVNPFTRVPYKAKELPTALPRLVAVAPDRLPPGLVMPAGARPVVQQNLMAFYGPDDEPFLCLPGVLAYHRHPAHTGDSWFLHRTAGDGRLVTILNHLHRYGIMGLQLNVEIRAQVTGFAYQGLQE